MTHQRDYSTGLTLYSPIGERKYLCASERDRFYAALDVLDDPRDRSFCETIFWTGCRPSEALGLSALNIDLADGVVVIRSLKKRGKLKGRHFRPVPVPWPYLEMMDRVHGLRAIQAAPGGGACSELWTFSRTTAWKRMKAVMEAAGLTGVKACAKGLRHSYGVHAALSLVPETRIKTWLGHASLATTEIYTDMAAPEEREAAQRMWAA
ncbi:site-specific integrase [Maricaulis sp.]|uniref:tyrosine-type recombinase/integrase n=1 Tax=Maricaulis sp. TaxID=1486257 RepID=UPI00261FD746|nr:site-specific integrase [Maricaulis sp.]